jgi:hypothetical protein
MGALIPEVQDEIKNFAGLGKVESKFDGDIDGMQSRLEERAQNPNGVATTAYKKMANEGMGNALAGIAQTKGLNPSAQATMADIAGSRMQGQIADQAGLMGLQEQQMNENLLMNVLMARQQQDIANQQKNQEAKNKMIGMGLTAAGTAFGGPMGGMAASQAFNGMSASGGGGGGGGGVNMMGTNPYSGPAPTSAPMQYNPSQYNMGQSFKF